MLDKYRFLEEYTGFDLILGNRGSQKPQNATSTALSVAMPLLSSYTPREQPIKPPVIPGHTSHSSLSLLHKRLHADEEAHYDETISFILPSHLDTSADLPAPTNQHVNLRAVPHRVVACLAFDGECTLGYARQLVWALEDLLVADQLLPEGGAELEWCIAQYEFAPRTGRGGRNEVWVVLDGVGNPRIKAALAHERRRMNRANLATGGATATDGADGTDYVAATGDVAAGATDWSASTVTATAADAGDGIGGTGRSSNDLSGTKEGIVPPPHPRSVAV